MRLFIVALLLPLAAGPARAAQDSEHLHIDEVSESFLRQWSAAEESGNTKELLNLYAVAHETLAKKLAQPDPDVARWIPLTRVLAAKLAALPESALESHEVIARQVLETVLEPTERRKAIEKYAYTPSGRAALDQTANIDCDRGRLTEAMKGWASALEVRPGVETVARLGLAHALRRDGVSLVTLRAQAEARGIKGEVSVGGLKRELYEYLDSLLPAAAPTAPLLRPAPLPTCEIPLGHFEPKPSEDGRYGEQLAVSLPAAGRAGGKDLVVISNGFRVFAFDPGRAEGGGMEDALEWRWPKERLSRTWMLGSYNASLPYVGATIADGRVFCPMLADRQEARQQVGRRQQKFLGPSVLRAFDLATGEPLWDTETLEVAAAPAEEPRPAFRSAAGAGARKAESLPEAPAAPAPPAKLPMMEFLGLDKSDFCFGGPPLVRGGRLYAPVMTSPFTGRQCWVLCLNAATGQPLWCTDLGTAPQTKEMSVAQLAEEDGTLVVSTNFGVVATLDAETGGIEWLVKYITQNRTRRSQHRSAGSPPVIAGSLVYVLAQDCDELLAFDRWTGLEAPLVKRSQPIAWDGIAHLLGRAGDWLVFSGPKNVALRPVDGTVVALPDAERGIFGRGAIAGGRAYLPTRNELTIVDTGTWKVLQTLKWADPSSSGNLIVDGSLLIHVSNRLDLYTSPELLQQRFAAKVDAAAPSPVDCRQFARILEGSGRLKESVPYYRRALRAWENDPAWQETSESLKKKLADLAERLGDDFPKD